MKITKKSPRNNKYEEKKELTLCQDYICNVKRVVVVNKHNRRILNKTNTVMSHMMPGSSHHYSYNFKKWYIEYWWYAAGCTIYVAQSW